MKNYVDMLAVCGHPISEEDHVLSILGGVGVEYESVVVHITYRSDILSSADASTLLLAHEGHIESYHTNPDSAMSTVNATVFSQSKRREHYFPSIFSWPEPWSLLQRWSEELNKKTRRRASHSNTRENQLSPTAAMAMKQQEELNKDWSFPDSGASHHVTNDLGNLTIGSEYTGGGKVLIGNGSGLLLTYRNSGS